MDWHQCPIGQRHERELAQLTANQQSTLVRIEKIMASIEKLTQETSKLNGKLTLIISITLALVAAGFSFIFDMIETIAKHHVGG